MHTNQQRCRQSINTGENPPLKNSVVSGIKASILGILLATLFLVIKFRHPYSQEYNSNGIIQSVFAWEIISYLIFLVLSGAIFGAVMSKIVGNVGIIIAILVGMTYGMWIWIFCHYMLFTHLFSMFTDISAQQTVIIAHLIFGISLVLFGTTYRNLPHFIKTRMHRDRYMNI